MTHMCQTLLLEGQCPAVLLQPALKHLSGSLVMVRVCLIRAGAKLLDCPPRTEFDTADSGYVHTVGPNLIIFVSGSKILTAHTVTTVQI